jgi:hypothetical protein
MQAHQRKAWPANAVGEPSRPKTVAPENRRARILSRPNTVAPEYCRARKLSRPKTLAQISARANPHAHRRAAKSSCQLPQTLVGPHTAPPCLSHPTFRAGSKSCPDAQWCGRVGPIRVANAGPPAEGVAGKRGRRTVAPENCRGRIPSRPETVAAGNRRAQKPSRKSARGPTFTHTGAPPNQAASCLKRWWARKRLRRVCPTLRFAPAANLAPMRNGAVGWDQFAQRMQAHQRKACPGNAGDEPSRPKTVAPKNLRAQKPSRPKALSQNCRGGESARKSARGWEAHWRFWAMKSASYLASQPFFAREMARGGIFRHLDSS